MNEWVSEWMNQQLNEMEFMNSWNDERMHAWNNGGISAWRDEWMKMNQGMKWTNKGREEGSKLTFKCKLIYQRIKG